MSSAKLIGQIAIFVALLSSIGVVVYQTITHQAVDIFFSSMLTLILGKYIQEVGFSSGANSASEHINAALTTNAASSE